ncbi:hypothetical protein [Curtobacterium sp. 'Ferrero']|uniref:hypothetical protein n=1 Tax=Curtobacterium sp. 'Ferrero' TaxID=2033654 RepID=UPI001141915B|nr:hypothetical protein [Curtobacterium sp. 'Ferrero']
MPVDHFAITVPRSWFELPVEPDRRDDRISTLVQDRIAEHRELWDHRTEIVRVLRRFARSAWDSGARYCAAFAEPSEDGVVSGALTVTVLPAPGDQDDPTGSLIDHVAALGGNDAGMHVDVHDLPRAGRVPRVWGTSTVQAPDDRGSFDVVLMQTFVPADGQVALVSVSSPATDLAEPLLELFETVTDTFELLDSAAGSDGVR